MKIEIAEIRSKKELKEFVKFPNVLYKDCEYFVPAIFRKEMFTLNKKKNPAFEFCDARYWMAYIDNKPVGRIAGIINHIYNEQKNVKQIRFGWFDVVDDKEVAGKLLDCVEEWGRSQKMEEIFGPIGFISFDPSGILVEGFDKMQTPFGTYNYPYYNNLLVEKGYVKEVDWLEYRIKVPELIPERITKGAELVKKRYELTDVQIDHKKDVLEYVDELFTILNKAYNNLFGFSELTPAVIENLKNDFYSLINPDYVSIIKNKNDEIIAFGIAVPSLGQALKKAGGKLFPFGFLHLAKAIKKHDSVDLLLIGVRPDYRKRGVHSIIFLKQMKVMMRNGVKSVNVTKTLEENIDVANLWEGYDYVMTKRTRGMRKGQGGRF